jgi:3-oxoacyl-[acyl-carrier protein] reductase
VILGASGTIGSCVAERLVSGGDQVYLLGRSEDKLREVASRLNQPFCALSLHDSVLINDCLSKYASEHGPIGGIVNCIGSILLKPAHLTTDAEFQETITTNLLTSFATVKSGALQMREHGGSIVLFASAAAQIGIANHEAIAAAKAGIIGLARSAAATYAPNNIRVNVVSPGLVKTELTKRIWGNPTNANASTTMHALGRLGEPGQVASLVTWLLASEQDWITGQVIGIDGGLGSVLPRK